MNREGASKKSPEHQTPDGHNFEAVENLPKKTEKAVKKRQQAGARNAVDEEDRKERRSDKEVLGRGKQEERRTKEKHQRGSELPLV